MTKKQPAKQPAPRRLVPVLASTDQPATLYVADTRLQHIVIDGDRHDAADLIAAILEFADAAGHVVVPAGAKPTRAPAGDAVMFVAVTDVTADVDELLRSKPARVVVIVSGRCAPRWRAARFTALGGGRFEHTIGGVAHAGIIRRRTAERGVA